MRAELVVPRRERSLQLRERIFRVVMPESREALTLRPVRPPNRQTRTVPILEDVITLKLR
jgi:hypothetical protein